MYAEKLLLEGCFKSIYNKLNGANKILYAEDETGNYVVIDVCAAFRITDMFNSEVVCKMLHNDFPYGEAQMLKLHEKIRKQVFPDERK